MEKNHSGILINGNEIKEISVGISIVKHLISVCVVHICSPWMHHFILPQQKK